MSRLPTGRSWRRLVRLAGPVAVVVTLGGILLATALSTTFSWWSSALSDLGVVPATAWLFNGALVLGGAVGAIHTWALWRAASGRLARARAVTYLIALVAMAGVGLAPAGRPLHVPFAGTFFLLAALTAVLDGLTRPRTTAGRLALLTGLLAVGVWPVWLRFVPDAGIAIPEFVGAVLFGLWVVVLSPEGIRRSA